MTGLQALSSLWSLVNPRRLLPFTTRGQDLQLQGVVVVESKHELEVKGSGTLSLEALLQNAPRQAAAATPPTHLDVDRDSILLPGVPEPEPDVPEPEAYPYLMSATPDQLDSGLAHQAPECAESVAETSSICSVLSTHSISSCPLSAWPGPSRRTDLDCWIYLARGSFDGAWRCNQEASSMPNGLAPWACDIQVHGDIVVLGTGEQVELQVREGEIFLQSGKMTRVGDRLLRVGKSTTLVYQRLGDVGLFFEVEP
eukprot:TRINITY_DN111445_c0_g1_i1.p1 TRINITY_DN111445_c0_g1~~TRINITY_DN111445_c0_g1_i1.p1  ORF type:complete len:255 (-),score=12.90 TRINITY_DN111445_c0_g1_i1:318-1082(-)